MTDTTPIANPWDYSFWDRLWHLQFGAYSTVNVYVWASDLESALETAVEWLDDEGMYGFFTFLTEEDYQEAAESLGVPWDPRDPSWEAVELVETDMYIVGHTTLSCAERGTPCIPSWEWWAEEVQRQDWIDEIAERSRREE